MHYNCSVPSCRQSYSSSASLRSHLAQASDHAHRKYNEDLYRALDFDVNAAVLALKATLPIDTLLPVHPVTRRPVPPVPPETHLHLRNEDGDIEDDDDEAYEDNDDDDNDDEDDEDADNSSEIPDLVDNQEDRELTVEVEEMEEDLDVVAEVMENILKEFHLASEEELVECLSVPFIAEEEIQATPNSQSRRLVESPDTRFTHWHPTAGEVRSVDSSVRERWSKLFEDHDKGESYKPFGLLTDWELVRWAVTEKIKQGSLDRLLSIPGVRVTSNCKARLTQTSTSFRC